MAKEKTAEIPGIVYIASMGDTMAAKAGRDDLSNSAFLKAFGLDGKEGSALVFDADKQQMGLRPSWQISNPELAAQIKGSEWASPEKLAEAQKVLVDIRENNTAYRSNPPTVAPEDRQILFVPMYKVENGQVALDEQTKMPTPVAAGFVRNLKSEMPTMSANLSNVINFVPHTFNPATGTEGAWVVSKQALETIGGLKEILAPYMPSPESQEKARVAAEFQKQMPATVNAAAQRTGRERDAEKVYIPESRVVGNGLTNLFKEFDLLETPAAFKRTLGALQSEKGKVTKQIDIAEQTVARAMADIDKAAIARGDVFTENGVTKARYTREEERAAFKQARVENRLDGEAPRFGQKVVASKLPLQTIAQGYDKALEKLQQVFEKRHFRDGEGKLLSFADLPKYGEPTKAESKAGPTLEGAEKSKATIMNKFAKAPAL